jgi:hypothetical protein
MCLMDKRMLRLDIVQKGELSMSHHIFRHPCGPTPRLDPQRCLVRLDPVLGLGLCSKYEAPL